MMGWLKNLLGRHPVLRLTANHGYVYVIHLLHVILNLTPWFVRGACFRWMMGRCGGQLFLDHDVYIKFPWLVEMGRRVSINRGVSLYPDFFGGHRIILGDRVRVAPNVRFHAASHEIGDQSYAETGGTIRVGDDVWVGAAAMILPGVTIGDRSVVGAGSVVTRDVPPDTVVAGVPARVVRDLTAPADTDPAAVPDHPPGDPA